MNEWSDQDERPCILVRLEFSAWLTFHCLSLFLTLALLVGPVKATAHPGGLAADGCHNDRKNGGRHCHRGGTTSAASRPSQTSEVYYPNCAAARQAGAAPVYRGQPGYARHLDRDNDGIGCE